MDSAQLDLLLNSIEEVCSAQERERVWLPFMFDCVNLVEDQLPTVARESLSVAKFFANGLSETETLDRAVVTCWKALGNGPQSLEFGNPQVAGIRAVICILRGQLYSEDKRLHSECADFVDFMSFYLQLLNNVEPRLEQQEVLIRKWFSECL